MGRTILIADDNEGIRDILSAYCKKEGYKPVVAVDGDEAITKFYEHNPILILLDVLMPNKDGFEVCKEIRSKSNVPIIMVTARGEDGDKIMGLDIGADDYIVKPFSAAEVMARIRAILRRLDITDEQKKEGLKVGDLEINMESYEVLAGGKQVQLTKKEIDVLWLMVSNPGKVFSRENLLESVWGYDYFGDARTVDTHIKRLRAKIELSEKRQWEIRTIWGVGYKFEVKHHE